MVTLVPLEFGSYYWAAFIGVVGELLIVHTVARYLDIEVPGWIWALAIFAGAVGVPAWLWYLTEVGF